MHTEALQGYKVNGDFGEATLGESDLHKNSQSVHADVYRRSSMFIGYAIGH